MVVLEFDQSYSGSQQLLNAHEDIAALQAEACVGGLAWYDLLDAVLSRYSEAAGPHQKMVTQVHTAPADGLSGAWRRMTGRSSARMEIRCQLPDSFSPAGSQTPPDLQHGFCWGHLPANYGGVQLCLLISGTERNAQYPFRDVKLRLSKRQSTVSGSSAGSDCTPSDCPNAEPAAAQNVTEEVVLELVSMWPSQGGIVAPQEDATHYHTRWLSPY